MKNRLTIYCCGVWLLLLVGGAAWHTTCAAQELAVTASFTAAQTVAPDEAIFLRLNRTLTAGEGRVGVVFGNSDVSSLFAAMDGKFVYDPKIMPLPLGAATVVVYLVTPAGDWRELARFTLNVAARVSVAAPQVTPAVAVTPDAASSATPAPNVAAAPNVTATPAPSRLLKLTPSVTLGLKSQPFLRVFPDSSRPARDNFSDFTLQGGLRGEMQRGIFKNATQIDIAGGSFQQEALRFGTLGDAAPQVDLSSYLMQMEIGRAKINIGHTSFGTLRHLANNFSSRGITLTLPFLRRFDVTAGVLNGTSIVGYNNLAGLARKRHQMHGLTLGYEFFPARPGGLRVELGGFNGYFQALNGFAQGSVNDVERSKGGAVRVLFADKTQRFKAEGGFTRSRFQNPADALLDQNANVIRVPALVRNARYGEATAELLRNVTVTATRKLSLTLGWRYERVEPLFKSLGAGTQADKTQSDYQLNGTFGDINFSAMHTRFNDNLRPVPSILRSLTRLTQFSVAIPTASFFSNPAQPSPFFPRLGYNFSRTHAFGAGIPVNGGFEVALDAIPDQLATNQSLSAEWQFPKFTFGYAYNRSLADNRQTGREVADLLNQTHTFRVVVTPLQTLNFGFDLSRDSSSNKEIQRLDGTWRAAVTMTWQVTKNLAWTGNVSHTLAGDEARTTRNRNLEFDTQLAFSLDRQRSELQKVKTQIFLRYANRFAHLRDNLLFSSDFNKQQTLNAGLSLTFF